MNVSIQRVTMVLAAVGCAFALAACEQPDWSSPDYIIKKLEEGDATERQAAIQNIDELAEEDQQKVASALAKVYLSDGPNQKEAMKLLVQIRSPEAKDAYLQEVREDETGYAGAAAEALGLANVTEALDPMIELYKSTDDSDLQQNLLRGFYHMPDPRMVPMLAETLQLDADNFPIRLHSDSCDILGDIAAESPEAIDEPARHALVKGLFVANNKGQDVAKECSLAVQKLGAPAVPLLLETFKGNNAAVNKLLRKYNQGPDYQFPANKAKADTAIMLGRMKADQATEVFLKDLSAEKGAPKQLAGKHAVSWRMTEGRAVSEQLKALGEIGDTEAVELMVDVVKDEYTNDEWDEITDALIELQIRQDAAFALVRVGDRKAADALLGMAKDGVVIDLERRAGILAKRGQPMPVSQRYQFNWMMAQAYASLVGADGKKALEELAAGTEEEELKKKYESFIPMIEKGGECLSQDKADAQAKCFGKMLASDDKLLQEKAAYELSRLPSEAAAPVVNEHLDHEKLTTRELVIFAAHRVGNDATIAKVDQLLDDDSANSNEEKAIRLELEHLRAWLANNSEAVAKK